MAENVLLKILQGIILTQNYRTAVVDSICCTADAAEPARCGPKRVHPVMLASPSYTFSPVARRA
jgi:hypothetical protein